ncbi:MAG TPA: DUF2357 domain-containing protein [Symbiobacteriaceae bacterium]|jgi:hypothetical protein
METTPELCIPILDDGGVDRGHLWIGLPASKKNDGAVPPIANLRDDPDRDPSVEPFQIREGTEYLYRIHLDNAATGDVDLEPRELFSADTPDWRQGRLRPRLATGTLTVTVRVGEQVMGHALLEVRSLKLGYLQEYRWMLEYLAEKLTEVVMERFAPTEQRFAMDDTTDATTLYQQFAFLKHLISGPTFELAMQQILARPHRTWLTEEEAVRPGQSLPAGSAACRQMARAGRRVPWEVPGAPLSTLPAVLMKQRTQETLDTPENRFIQFALTRWRNFVLDVENALAREKPNAPVRRGLREVGIIAGRLDEVLASDLFDEVGPLVQFPEGSQVLQKREGYREIFRAYIQFETAALLTWEGGADVYAAGRRDVAKLYEYWVFFRLVEIVSRICQQDFDLRSLFEWRKDGLGVAIKRGEARALAGSVSLLGRRLEIELWYNPEFSQTSNHGRSWTTKMKPDYSLRIKPAISYLDEEVWLHFDAKYRVEAATDLFVDDLGADGEAGLPAAQGRELKAKPGDLYKMHTYRDAIKRSAGAYVIYPGTDKVEKQEYHELLPGLGAFPLRPLEDGEGSGEQALERFIRKALHHLAAQQTEHERTRYWIHAANHPVHDRPQHSEVVPFLSHPPADTKVLLGYVRRRRQWEWIESQLRYNLRADDRDGSVRIFGSEEIAAEFVVLYADFTQELQLWRVTGPPEIWTRERMVKSGYHEPGSSAYICLPIEPVEAETWLSRIPRQRFGSLRRQKKGDAPRGTPVATTWAELFRE